MDLRSNPNIFRKKPNPLVYLINYINNNIVSFVYDQQHAKEIAFIKQQKGP